MDIYNLINSKAIQEHCRKIKHQFNTEELAVLIYRNKRMSIDEKITAYQELITDYPDMEVIERINCKHYDSVKDMIQEEIQRLRDLIEKLEKEETNYEITAEYLVTENKELKMVNIYDYKSDWLDISNICLNIPTPFKKGDLLVSTSKTPFSEGRILSYDKYPFVLHWLCTWRENFQKMLDKGSHDSSDMQGTGYYISDNEIILENNHDYDSWEYFTGELKGTEKILKAISSLINNKITVELFVRAYDDIRAEQNKRTLTSCFTEEGLKLAGFNDEDIKRIKR